jgi:glyoxylase-like metal-dependent hydrolase (beta-lactamase superfamily II)
MVEDTYHFKVGNFACTVIKDGGGPRDVSNMYVGVTRDEVVEALKPHHLDVEALEFSINILLVKTGQHQVLVDTGNGSMRGGRLVESLRSVGVEPGAITTVVITHGHGDHVGGLTEGGKLVFPNAQTWMPKVDWDYYTSEAFLATLDQAVASYAVENFYHPLKDRIRLFEGETEIMPGICVFPTPGHTYGHSAVEVTAGGEKLVQVADAIHHPFQIGHLRWSPHFDAQPDVAAETRRRLVARAASEQSLVIAYHFPFPGLGRIVGSDGAWAWQPVS